MLVHCPHFPGPTAGTLQRPASISCVPNPASDSPGPLPCRADCAAGTDGPSKSRTREGGPSRHSATVAERSETARPGSVAPAWLHDGFPNSRRRIRIAHPGTTARHAVPSARPLYGRRARIQWIEPGPGRNSWPDKLPRLTRVCRNRFRPAQSVHMGQAYGLCAIRFRLLRHSPYAPQT